MVINISVTDDQINWVTCVGNAVVVEFTLRDNDEATEFAARIEKAIAAKTAIVESGRRSWWHWR